MASNSAQNDWRGVDLVVLHGDGSCDSVSGAGMVDDDVPNGYSTNFGGR